MAGLLMRKTCYVRMQRGGVDFCLGKFGKGVWVDGGVRSER